MRILVAGASGALGRPLVQKLVRAGHTVSGLVRTLSGADIVRRLGAEAIVADGLDAQQVRGAVSSTRPEVIVHEMTGLRGISDLPSLDRTFATTNLLRTRGTDLLLAAAREAGVGRFIAQSYCGWPYARVGGPVKSEDDPLDPDPPRDMRHTPWRQSDIWNLL